MIRARRLNSGRATMAKYRDVALASVTSTSSHPDLDEVRRCR
jgi:hypothetical protein